MREVVNISLQGVSFTVESNALELLEQYLDELRQYYGEGEAEVVNDIEERIAELLIERGCKDSTVRYHHVDEIINILGHPNQMEGEENPKKGKKVKRRIFRCVQRFGCILEYGCSVGENPLLFGVVCNYGSGILYREDNSEN